MPFLDGVDVRELLFIGEVALLGVFIAMYLAAPGNQNFFDTVANNVIGFPVCQSAFCFGPSQASLSTVATYAQALWTSQSTGQGILPTIVLTTNVTSVCTTSDLRFLCILGPIGTALAGTGDTVVLFGGGYIFNLLTLILSSLDIFKGLLGMIVILDVGYKLQQVQTNIENGAALEQGLWTRR